MLSRKLRLVVCALAALAAVCVTTEAFCSLALHLPFVYTFPLLPKWGLDFRIWIPKMRLIHTPAFETALGVPYLYPPAAAPIQWIFSVLPWRPTAFFYLAGAAIAIGADVLFARALQRRGATTVRAFAFSLGMTIFSLPIWFVFRQGNIEMLLFPLIAGAVWAYLEDRLYLSAICIGVAGAAKIYPLILVGLFLSRANWRPVIVTAVVAILATTAGLWLIHPDLRVALAETQRGLTFANDLQFLHQNPVQGGFDHSVLGAAKRVVTHWPAPGRARFWVKAYIVSLAALGLSAFLFRLRRTSPLNKVLGLTVAMVTFMPLSYDYTLIHMYVPFGLLALQVQSAEGRFQRWEIGTSLSCFVVVFAPLSEFIWHGTTVSGLFKTIGLLCLFSLSLGRDLTLDADVQQGQPSSRRSSDALA